MPTQRRAALTTPKLKTITVPKSPKAQTVHDLDASTETVTETITPEKAYEYLDTAFGVPGIVNRPVSQQHVARLAADMAAGQWEVTDQGIGFDTRGVLRNGQHRLWAIITAGVAVRMNVTRGMSDRAFDVIDQGKRRTADQIIAMHGVTFAKAMTTAAAWQALCDRGTLGGADQRSVSRLSVQDRLDVLERHPKMADSPNVIAQFKGLRLMIPEGLLVWLHYQLSLCETLRAVEFFRLLREGTGLSVDDPIWLLRERLKSNSSTRRRMSQTEIAALVIKAWNLWLRGDHRELLVWRTTEAFPVPERPT